MKSFRKQSGNFLKNVKMGEIKNSKLISKVFSQILTRINQIMAKDTF